MDELKKLGLWTPELRDAIKLAEGSIQGIAAHPAGRCAQIYRTAWELPMRALIDMAAERGAFIDQSASLNLFMESPNIGATVVDVHARVEAGHQDHVLPALAAGDEDREDRRWAAMAKRRRRVPPVEAVACSLENPESCEACQ